MKREQTLRQRLASLRMLDDAVNGMKSLSAHHLRLARIGLASARAYREGIDGVLGLIGIAQPAPDADVPAWLLVAADLGLCDGYTPQLVEMVRTRRGSAVERLYCVGRRPLPVLRRAGVEVARAYDAAPSVDGLPRVLLTLADDVFGDYLRGRFTRLMVVSARFDGVGSFTPIVTKVLPIEATQTDGPRRATPYVSRALLARVAVREYLYSTLYELLLDALAAEHGTRLVATEAAGQWLGEQIGRLQHELAGVRQETSTQEVLDVASAARMRRRAH